MGVFGFGIREKKQLDGTIKVCGSKEHLVKIKNVWSNTDLIEACTKQSSNTNWKTYKVTKIHVFVALLREIAWGVKAQ